MTVKQIMKLSDETLYKKCHDNCETKDCPFPKYLWKYREDGCCIAECFFYVDLWIGMDEKEIEKYHSKIERLEERIAKYKEFKKKMEEELK